MNWRGEGRERAGRRAWCRCPTAPSPFSLAGVVRASSIFPILSAILLLLGGVCVAASRVYKSKRNIILGAGILFVAAGERQSEGAVSGARAYLCVCTRVRARESAEPLGPGALLGPRAFLGSSRAPSTPAGPGRCCHRAVFEEVNQHRQVSSA